MTTRREILAYAAAIVPAADGLMLVTLDEVVTEPEEHIVQLALRSDPHDQRKAWDDALAEAASRAGAGPGIVELEPGARYVAVPLRSGDRSEDIQAAFGFPHSIADVLVRTRGEPAVGDPAQAVLTVPPWEDQRGVRWQCVVRMSGEDQHLRSVRIDGGKLTTGTTKATREAWLKDGMDYSKGGNGGVHAIALRGGLGSSLVDVEAFDALTDGIDVDESDRDQVRRFFGLRCDFHHNRRQGMSTKRFGVPDGGIDQVVFDKCRFRWTGDDERGMVGQKPGFGIDMEPNHKSDVSFGGTLIDCECNDNQGSSMSNGTSASKTPGRSFCVENKGVHTDLRVIRLRASNNAGCVKINMRGQDIVRLVVEGLVAKSNGEGNRLWFAREGGKLIDARLIDSDVSEILFQDNMDSTGHSVTIWRGYRQPKITGGCKVVTVRNGMP